MFRKIKKIFGHLGPGFISGAADDDPTAIATYTQAGAKFGYSPLWTTLFTIPFMIAIQEMCGRIGMVTGKGLSGVIRKNFSRPILYIAVLLLFVSSVVNIGAGLGAMASAAGLIFKIPFVILVLAMTAISLTLEVFVSYEVYSKYLKFLAISLLTYVGVVLLIKQDWGKIIFSTLIPTLGSSKDYLLMLIAILGTSISPYLFFWQADSEVEEEVVNHKLRAMGRGVPKVTNMDLRLLRTDTAIGMILSNIVIFFVCITAAATLGKNGIGDVATASDAAAALIPLVGKFAFLLFALGIIGSGLLSVPILAGSASYAISEAFGWKEGLSKKFTQAHGFYGVIIIATLVGLIINFVGVKPFQMLIYAAAINGILAPPLLVLILIIANHNTIMQGHTNSKLSNILGVIITLIMSLATIAFFVSLTK